MKSNNWLFGAGLAVLGLLLIIFPAFWIKLVVIILGLSSIAYGIYNLKITKLISNDDFYKKIILIRSGASITIGVLAVVFPLAIGEAMWSAMIYILAIYLILAAAIGFYSVSLLKDAGIDRKRYIFENLFLVIAAVLLFLIGPKNLGEAIIRIVGIAGFLVGAALLFISYSGAKKEKAENIVVESSEVIVENSASESSEDNE